MVAVVNLLLRSFFLLLCLLVCFFFLHCFIFPGRNVLLDWCVCFELKFYTFFGCHRFSECVWVFFLFLILFLLLCVFLWMCKVSTRTSFLLPYAIHPVFHFFWSLSFVRDPIVFVRIFFFFFFFHFVCFCLIFFTNRHVLFVCRGVCLSLSLSFFYSYFSFHSSIYIFRSDFCTDFSFSHQEKRKIYMPWNCVWRWQFR